MRDVYVRQGRGRDQAGLSVEVASLDFSLSHARAQDHRASVPTVHRSNYNTISQLL